MAKYIARLSLFLLSFGVAASAQAQIAVDVVARNIYFNSKTGAKISSGTAAPTASDPNGSMYLRVTTGTSTLYCRQDSAWVLCNSSGTPSFPLLASSGSSGAPSYAFSAEATLGFYRPSSGNIGITGSLLPSASASKNLGSSSLLFNDGYLTRLAVGNGSISFTTPTKYAHFINSFSAVNGATQYAGQQIETTFTTATSTWSAGGWGFLSKETTAGNQAMSSTVYAGLFQATDTTSGLMAESLGVRAEVSRSTGTTTFAAPLSGICTTTSSGTITTCAGLKIYTPVNAGSAITNVVGVSVADQSLGGVTQKELELQGANSSGWTTFSDGTVSGVANQTTSTTLQSSATFVADRNYTGNGAYANASFAASHTTTMTPSADLAQDGFGVYGGGKAAGTHKTRTVYGVYGVGDTAGSATTDTWNSTVGGGLFGVVGDAYTTGSGTIPDAASVLAWGGTNTGATFTRLRGFWVPNLYDFSGTIGTYCALCVDSITTTGMTTAYALLIGSPNTGSANQGVMANGLPFSGVQAVTIADNGGGTNATQTITPTAGQVEVTCNDAQACDVTIGESAIPYGGGPVTFICMSTAVSNFADTSGVSETAGAFACGQYDTITFRYAGAAGTTGRWVETGRSNN